MTLYHALKPFGAVHLHSFSDNYSMDYYVRDSNSVSLHRDKMRSLGDPPYRVVTAVRDPLERAISAFAFSRQRYSDGDDYGVFMSEFKHDWYLAWFDDELKKNIGIDVFSEDIDPSRLWWCFEDSGSLVFVVKFPNFKSAASSLSDYLWPGASRKLRFGWAHNTASKPHSKHKQNLQVKYPIAFVRRLVGSKLVQTFFTESEREAMISRWA